MSVLDRPMEPAGWYHAQGDPPDTYRFWDGGAWHGRPAWPLAGSRVVGPVVAGAGARFGALLADGFISAVIAFVLAIFFAMQGAGRASPSLVDQLLRFVVLSGVVLVPLIMTSATLGKRLAGLRVVRRDTLETIDPKTALVRCGPMLTLMVLQLTPLAILASGVGVVLTLVSAVLVLSDDEARSVYDRIAGTIVVKG